MMSLFWWFAVVVPTALSLSYSGLMRPGVVSPRRLIPSHIRRPDYADHPLGIPRPPSSHQANDIPVLSKDDIATMKVAGRLAREILDEAIRAVKVGVTTTDDIDVVVTNACIERNVYPSPLGYHGFPKSCCTSINEVICHGIPDSTVIPNNSLLNIDITIFHEGFHADCSETILLQDQTQTNADNKSSDDNQLRFEDILDKKALLLLTYQSFLAALSVCKPGVPFNQIGNIIEDVIDGIFPETTHGQIDNNYLLQRKSMDSASVSSLAAAIADDSLQRRRKDTSYYSVRGFVGHGVGRVFHTNPNIYHYRNNIETRLMLPGHCFTIEPMICIDQFLAQRSRVGGNRRKSQDKGTITWADDWTVTTHNGKSSAQFEHTVLVNEENGIDIITQKIPSSPKQFWEH